MACFKKNKSIVRHLTIAAVLVVFSTLCIAVFANYLHLSLQADRDHKEQLSIQLELLSQILESPLWSFDTETVALIGDAYLANRDVSSLKIYSEFKDDPVYQKYKASTSKVLVGDQDITYSEKIIGRVEVGLGRSAYDTSLANHLKFSVIFIVLLLLPMGYMIRKVLRNQLQVPLDNLGSWTDKVADGEYLAGIPQIELEELNAFVEKFSNMANEVHQREKSLLASGQRFRGLFENSEVAVWNEDFSGVIEVLDRLREQGVADLRKHLNENRDSAWQIADKIRVIQVNQAAFQLFDASPDDKGLLQISKTFGPDTIDTLIDELCAIWDGEQHFRAETTFRSLRGKLIHAILSFHIPQEKEGFSSVPITIVDITELKSTEDKLLEYQNRLEEIVEAKTRELLSAQKELVKKERLATLGQLTGTVSHELNNPLGSILNSLYLLEAIYKDQASDDAIQAFQRAGRGINRCINIIEHLNDYARVKELNVTEVSLDQWLAETLDDYVFSDEIELAIDLSCEAVVNLDRERLQQVVVNLLRNAEHALLDQDSTGKTLQVSTRRAGRFYEIRVSDNGIGMSAETIEKVYEPLYSTKNFGMGLGMLIVKNIVEQHKGAINIESRQGKGTTVILRLPIDLCL